MAQVRDDLEEFWATAIEYVQSVCFTSLESLEERYRNDFLTSRNRPTRLAFGCSLNHASPDAQTNQTAV